MAADAIIDMECLGQCNVFLATGHSCFTYLPCAKPPRNRRAVLHAAGAEPACDAKPPRDIATSQGASCFTVIAYAAGVSSHSFMAGSRVRSERGSAITRMTTRCSPFARTGDS